MSSIKSYLTSGNKKIFISDAADESTDSLLPSDVVQVTLLICLIQLLLTLMVI
jgi:hypothetical protein